MHIGKRLWLVLSLALLAGSGDAAVRAQGGGRTPITPGNAAQVTELVVLRQERVTDLAWSPDGETLAVAGETGIGLYCAADWSAPPRPLEGYDGAALSVAYSPDGNILASGGRDGNVRLWDAAAGEMLTVLEGHSGPVQSLTIAPWEELASGGQDGTVRVWPLYGDLRDVSDSLAVLEGHRGPMTDVAYSPDGTVLAAASRYGAVRLWRVVVTGGVWHGESRTVLESETGPAMSLAYPPSLEGGTGRVLLAAGGWEGAIRLWPLVDGDRVWAEGGIVLAGHSGAVRSLAYSPLFLEYPQPPGHPTILASGGDDGTVRLWDASGATTPGEALILLEGHDGPVLSVAFSPDGALLASGSRDGTVRIWGLPDP